MTWEETIKFIRSKPEYRELVQSAYFEADLPLNVDRFIASAEYNETKKIIAEYIPFSASTRLLDIGSGNGISAVAFAIDKFQVTAVEPDPSETIGAGAIRKLKEHYELHNLGIQIGYAENLDLPDSSFDIVYARQCMHHANDLGAFIKECQRVLKKNGLLITVRDHVIYDEADKMLFLNTHPLHRFYGGENAYTCKEYREAMVNAGLCVVRVLKHFESPVNYFPLNTEEKEREEKKVEQLVEVIIRKKLGSLSRVGFIYKLAEKQVRKTIHSPFNEKEIPGRLYSFMALKK